MVKIQKEKIKQSLNQKKVVKLAVPAKLGKGNRITLKITALGPNNVGINEFSYAMPILVPNAKLGDTVQVQILKIYTKYNVAIAKLVKVLSKPAVKQAGANPAALGKGNASLVSTKTNKSNKSITSNVIANPGGLSSANQAAFGNQKEVNVASTAQLLKPGEVLDVMINKLGPNSTAIIELPNAYNNVKKLIVHSSENLHINQKVNVTVTRVKTNYGFAIINAADEATSAKKAAGVISPKGRLALSLTNQTLTGDPSLNQKFNGTKFSLVLPKKNKTGKSKGKLAVKHMVFKLSSKQSLNSSLFNNNALSPEGGLRERGSMVNSLESLINKKPNVLPLNTILFVKPRLGAKSGDKVQIQITKFVAANDSLKYNVAIAKIIKLNPMSAKQKKALVFASLRQMLKSGMHYGEKAIKCNARMKNYVWIRKKGQNSNKPLIKKGRNIINLLKTRRCLNKALAQLSKYAAKGKTFLFVGTKKAAAGLVSRASLFSKKAFFVNTRWLGGMLTNWKTIVKSISKIRPILKEKQIIIKDILQKRQSIKARLIQKALLLRKKSKLMLKKGRQLIQLLKTKKDKTYAEKTNILNSKRKELISKGILALEKRQQLLLKRQELIVQSQNLKSKAIHLTTAYRQLLTNLMVSRKKLRELKSLLIISKELQAFKQQAKEQNQNLYMVSYNKFRALNAPFIISNPPREILNKMVSIIKGQSLIIKDNRAESAFSSNLNLKTASTNLGPSLSEGSFIPFGDLGEGQVKGDNKLGTNQIKILSQLLSKFTLFVPTIKTSIKNLQNYTANIQISLNKVLNLLSLVKTKMLAFLNLKTKIVNELRQIKQTLQTERNIIRVLRRKLKQISSQKRLIKFLPKLRYLPTPTQKIEQTARFLMKKFVDPKMKYPMDSIYDDKLSGQSKKVAASRKKKWQRLEKYLGGISNMTKIKEKQIRNNVAIIIGQQEEMNAVRECQKLGIKMFHIVDTNCNPGFADHFIPANDDARNSIKFILAKFLTRIRLAHKLKNKFKKKAIKGNPF